MGRFRHQHAPRFQFPQHRHFECRGNRCSGDLGPDAHLFRGCRGLSWLGH
ncbi:hypothetical protein MGSAQ_002359 [marine sediment metagenome]|uniref:Uncharacterized protein n=1 Tax=marine sediment metagenome TaxID=412755 RepID=A0A1B6NRN1_9ZZZZ